MKRCEGEGLEASVEQARAALLAEDGHVGKTMIRLRRQRREAAEATPTISASGEATPVASEIKENSSAGDEQNQAPTMVQLCSQKQPLLASLVIVGFVAFWLRLRR